MKRVLLVLSFLFFSSTLMAQNVVGNVKRGPYLIAELTVINGDTSNLYKLRFLDVRKEILKSIEFNSKQSQIDELYLFFTKMLSEKNGESGDMQIGKYKINATNQKMLGLKNIVITIDEEYNFGLNGKEINKLFGK
jgi:hypothetical protein